MELHSSRDVLLRIFLILPSHFLIKVIPLVSKDWYKLANDDFLWEEKCHSEGFNEKQKSNTNYQKWYFQMLDTTFDTFVNVSEIEYIGDLKLRKRDNLPDASIAIVRRKITSGIAFCEFLVENKQDEMWIGITMDREKTSKIKGWDIVNNRDTWAYNDRRTGLEYGVHQFAAEGYSTGDKIGVLVFKDEGFVTFYKNGKQIGSSENSPQKLPTDVPVYFFVMTDYQGDVVSICNRY